MRIESIDLKISKFYFPDTIFDFNSDFLEKYPTRGICRSFFSVLFRKTVVPASQIKNAPSNILKKTLDNFTPINPAYIFKN